MKKILAVILALALTIGCAVALTSCGSKPEPAEESTALETIPETETPEESTISAPAEETSADAEVPSEDASEAETAEETTVEETTEAAKAAPSSTEDILKVYNDAVNSAVEGKAGYSKNRVTTISSLEGGALMKLDVVKEAVNSFLGVGTQNYTNSKGKAEFLTKATLAAGDVKSAECAEKDGKYTITITVKDGNSSANGGGKSDNSPLPKTGIFTGVGDNGAYDYKNAGNIYDCLNATDGASVESVKLTASAGKITAVVDAASGKLESLKVSFDFSVSMTNVKYTIAKVSAATGKATSVVTYSDFKY